jgi:hypothetical protein
MVEKLEWLIKIGMKSLYPLLRILTLVFQIDSKLKHALSKYIIRKTSNNI